MSNDLIIPEVENSVQDYDTLSKVVTKALKQIEIILDMDLEKEHPDDRMKMLSVKKDAAASIIHAGLKADENRFRRENKGIIEKLFEKIEKRSKIVDGHVIRKS